MGCSASRPVNFITQQENPTSNSCSSFANSHLQSPFSDPCSISTPVSRTLSLPSPLVHHPAVCKGDSNHFVSLTSTTYGSLVLIDPQSPHGQMTKRSDFGGFSKDQLPHESVINTWELMEGLGDEDEFDFDMVDSPKKIGKRDHLDVSEIEESFEFVEYVDSRPLWQHLSEESLLAKMDTNVVSSYRRALLGRQNGGEKPRALFKPVKIESLESNDVNWNDVNCHVSDSKEVRSLPGTDDRIILYYTSLRGIRKTYEDCCAVRLIFRGFRVCVDERDISMDSSYRKELQDALRTKVVSLPQVFIQGKCIGGAEEIKQLHESGQLAKLLDGFPLMDLGLVCEVCGDARFMPCQTCNGSRKVYDEEEGKLSRCPDCNENGLVRCSNCCP